MKVAELFVITPISTTYVPFKLYILPLELKITSKAIFMGLVVGLLPVTMNVLSAVTISYASPENGPVQIGPYYKQAVEHINSAQEALQNGDTEGANNHLELAKQSLQSNQSDSGQ
ncbi:MAG: hypothetical protein ACRD8W_29410 [Nitrososphaeraceae archaeon]